MLSRIKAATFRTVGTIGAARLVAASDWRRSRLLILCYHGISLHDEHEANPRLYVPPQQFRDRLAQIERAGCSVVQLAEGLERLRDGTLPKAAVAITFDDGTRDFAEIAVPALQARGMPATLYLTTYYCDRPLPVFDPALAYLLWRGRQATLDIGAITGQPQTLPLGTADEREAAWSIISRHAAERQLSAGEKHLVLGQVAGQVGVDFDDFVATGMYQQMSAGQIAALPRDLIDVQLHTHRHRTPREEQAFRREILDNRAAIGVLWGRDDTSHFCYPSGDYWAEFLPWLRELGVESATTCVPGLASRTSEPLLLPRVLDSAQLSPEVFDAWLTGYAEFVPRRGVHRMSAERLRSTATVR